MLGDAIPVQAREARPHKGPVLVPSYWPFVGATVTPGCGKAGERAGSTCPIDVEGHKRRPPSKVGGLCHEFRF